LYEIRPTRLAWNKHRPACSPTRRAAIEEFEDEEETDEETEARRASTRYEAAARNPQTVATAKAIVNSGRLIRGEPLLQKILQQQQQPQGNSGPTLYQPLKDLVACEVALRILNAGRAARQDAPLKKLGVVELIGGAYVRRPFRR
jgi:hypothetical protein